ncbi:MAG: hypothetical protein ABEJ26_13825 [Halosimplex sp.]
MDESDDRNRDAEASQRSALPDPNAESTVVPSGLRRDVISVAALWFAGKVAPSLLEQPESGRADSPRRDHDGGSMSDHLSTPTGPTDDPDQSSPTWTVPPGQVQAALDRAADDSQSQVFLRPGTTYSPSETWTVPSGITLDYNGASVELRADIDVHEIGPGGCVERPVVDLRSVSGGFSSSVFRFDSARFGFYGDNSPWHVRGGLTRGTNGNGTLFEFAQGGDSAIYFVHADHAVRGIGTVVDMHRRGQFGINGVRIYGVWYGFETGIRMRSRDSLSEAVDNISGNHFDVIAQPEDSSILWDLEAGRFNVLRGRLWDYSGYSDVMWRIHADGAEKRIGNLLHWFPVGSFEEQLIDQIGPRVFDDRLGDPRNRIIIPWLQGRPIGDFSD